MRRPDSEQTVASERHSAVFPIVGRSVANSQLLSMQQILVEVSVCREYNLCPRGDIVDKDHPKVGRDRRNCTLAFAVVISHIVLDLVLLIRTYRATRIARSICSLLTLRFGVRHATYW